MRRLSFVSAPVLAAACLLAVAGLAAQQPAVHPVSIPDLLSMKQVGSPQLSPDGRTVLYTVRGWENAAGRESQRKDARSHIWRVNTDGTGVRQLTFSERGETLPQWSPDGKTIAFVSSRDSGSASAGAAPGDGEGPIAQLWTMPADGGEARKLTDTKESVTAYAWSPNGKTIAYVARDPLSKDSDDKRKRRDDPQVFEGDFRLSHLFAVDVEGAANAHAEAMELVHDAALTVRGEPTWSADSSRIAFAAAPTTMIRDDRSDIYLVAARAANGKGATAEKITTNVGPDTDPAWSPDGSTIAFLSSPNTGTPLGDGIPLQRVGNEHLMLYDVATKKTKDAARPEFDLSPGPLHWAADSRSILFSTGVKTYRDVFIYDVGTSNYTQATHDRLASLGSVGKAGIALVMESSSEPAEIYFAENARSAPRKLTDTNPHARSFALGKAEVVSWKSDNYTIEGVLLKPVNYQEGKKYPLMVVAHGGPTGAHTNGYRVGYGDGGENFAGEGWAVLYPNPRGSSGYGEKFTQANFNDWGGGDYRDIMTGVDAMIARGIADPDKLAFQGWSYGGYMTAWVVSQTSRFKAAMMGAGIPDLVSMYNTNDIPNYLGTFFGGIPSKQTLPLYIERSGITYVDRVTTPLLILHGGSDQRVPIGQPMEYFRALKDRGKTVQLVFYPREGHGFSEYYHQLDRMQRQHDWITRYTLGATGKKTSDQ
jgi:dipeptidyl aminopeptidase/acylaminoacyl peptidase